MARPLPLRLAPAVAGRVRRPAGPVPRSSGRLAAPPLLAGNARAARARLERALERPRARVALLCVLIALPLLGGGWLLLRHSSFVAVQSVQLSGVHGPQASAIDAALLDAAHHMSTLDVNTGALRAAVAAFPVVRDVRASPSFPHGLHIRVILQLPVAALQQSGVRTAVAADGVVLGPALLGGTLPTLAAALEPLPGQRVKDPGLLAALAVLGAEPAPLASQVATVYSGPRGLTVAMRNGLLAYFGDATRPHAKWISLARVLADTSSVGASYVDVRLPDRPAAGFPGGVPPAGLPSASGSGSAEAPAAEAKPGSETAVGALAAGLAAHGGAGTSAAGTESPSTPAGAGSTTPGEATSTTPSSTPTEGAPAGAGEEPRASSEASG